MSKKVFNRPVIIEQTSTIEVEPMMGEASASKLLK